MQGGGFNPNFGTPRNAGANPPSGVVINYFVRNPGDSVKASMTIMDKNKKVIKTYSTDSKDNKLDLNKGMNQFNWDLLYPEAERAEGMILWNGSPAGIVP